MVPKTFSVWICVYVCPTPTFPSTLFIFYYPSAEMTVENMSSFNAAINNSSNDGSQQCFSHQGPMGDAWLCLYSS